MNEFAMIVSNFKKDLSNWTPMLFVDKDLLPAGRGWETYVEDAFGNPVELRIVDDEKGKFIGYVDRVELAESDDASDCAEFLVDWAELG